MEGGVRPGTEQRRALPGEVRQALALRHAHEPRAVVAGVEGRGREAVVVARAYSAPEGRLQRLALPRCSGGYTGAERTISGWY